MTMRRFRVGSGGLVIAALMCLLGPETARENTAVSPGIGDARALRASYERWKARYESTDGGGRTLVLPLGYSKGLSTQFTTARGQMRLDLADGTVTVRVAGLPAQEAFAVWLVDNREGSGSSVKPERGDTLLHLGTLRHQPGGATLETRLDRAQLSGFKIDLVVVTRAGETPLDGSFLFGSPTLFQRLYHSERSGRLAAFARRGQGATLTAAELLAAPFRALIARPAHADEADLATALEALIAEGETLFFEETFNGNGRTCGTCHPAQNNFAIDPVFIATLPPTDPLFVAEFIPALSKNFENPTLMRQFGLILENVDGFDDLKNKFVMRGVPHTLALSTSLTAAAGGLSEATGWSGDGAPGSGSLRDFATGAVTQHFTKTLKRRPGKDFRLPTDDELDALEAFQLSLGRQSELNLGALHLKPAGPRAPDPEDGKRLFNSSAKCSVCHANAGANAAFAPVNLNFNTGVEDAPHPAQGSGQPRPRDGGFGTAPNAAGGYGNGTFNTPTLVEAADTGPFFHNNAVATIEDAVRFYTMTAFSNSPAATGPFGVGAIVLTAQEVANIAAFLRTINALENIRSALEYSAKSRTAAHFGAAKKLLSLAIAETRDAINVLEGAGLYPAAVRQLKEARQKLGEARRAPFYTTRSRLIDQAVAYEGSARTVIVE